MTKSNKIMLALATVAMCLVFTPGCGSRQKVENTSTPSTSPVDGPDRGEEIVAEYLKRDAAPYRKVRVKFTVHTEGEADQIYEIETWRKQTPDVTTTLSQIVKSPDNTDVASLAIEPKGQKASVVTYAVSRDEFRETDTRKRFIGGLTAGELLGEWQKYAFRLVGEKDVDGRKVYEVEGKLKPDADSIASRMTVLFRADNYVPVELHLFDNNGREIRTYSSTGIKDDPVHPYAAKTEVDNPIYKAKITIEIVSREFPATIDDAVFSRDRLKAVSKK